MAIAAYVVPFSWGSIGQTQEQSSLYEAFHDRVNKIQKDVDISLDNLRGKFPDNEKAQKRLDEPKGELMSDLTMLRMG